MWNSRSQQDPLTAPGSPPGPVPCASCADPRVAARLRGLRARAQAYGGAIEHPADQLPAGRVNVLAARTPDGCDDTRTHELVAERRDSRVPRAPERIAGERVERDQVHLGRPALEQACHRARLRRRVLEA